MNQRYIPACATVTFTQNEGGAGPPRVRGKLGSELTQVHPRVCGGNAPGHPGTSPRVRGKLLPQQLLVCHLGYIPETPACGGLCARYIPACAGETTQVKIVGHHPRVCGGGTSPRVRGKRLLACAGETGNCQVRCIPACAGDVRAWIRDRVHPRVCGGNKTFHPSFHQPTGTSPRVRGKLPNILPEPFLRRYIPACAGETPSGFRPASLFAVHPRVCGGNSSL